MKPSSSVTLNRESFPLGSIYFNDVIDPTDDVLRNTETLVQPWEISDKKKVLSVLPVELGAGDSMSLPLRIYTIRGVVLLLQGLGFRGPRSDHFS